MMNERWTHIDDFLVRLSMQKCWASTMNNRANILQGKGEVRSEGFDLCSLKFGPSVGENVADPP